MFEDEVVDTGTQEYRAGRRTPGQPAGSGSGTSRVAPGCPPHRQEDHALDQDRESAHEDEEAARKAVSAERKPGVPPHQPPADERAKDPVDEGSEESMPASDPPASGGAGVG